MAKVLMTVQLPGERATLGAVKERYGLGDDEVDGRFGLVTVDPEAGIHTLMVEESAVPKLKSGEGATVKGPFSNPRIAPAGPPRYGSGG